MSEHMVDEGVVDDIDSDANQLQKLGIKQQFHRTIGAFDSFASSFCAVNFIGSVRLSFFIGILAGGPLAMWSSFLVNCVAVCITSAILAEICSALPISGSLYIWAAAAAGVKYGRIVGFVVAWWIVTSWMSALAVTCQGVALYVLSLLTVYNSNFPGGISNSNVKWRAVMWITSEGILALSTLVNYLPPRAYAILFRGSMVVILLDFFLCLIWLPIGVSRTYGLRTAREAFLATYDGTGAPAGWNWMLSFLFTSFILVGFDAAGHVAEETKNASVVAGRSIFRSAVATAVGGLAALILFLFCTPTIEILFSLNAPQPFVLIYSMALGHGGAVAMTLIAALGAMSSVAIMILAASRIIFAIARDGALPFSSWVATVTPNGRPQNAVTVVFVCTALLLCVILPSASAFTSLMSGVTVPFIASYGIVALFRLFVTPNEFRNTKFPLGRARRLLYAISVLFNGMAFVVTVSPFTFPVTAANLNFGGVIFGAITIFGLLSYWFTPEERWLPREKIREMCDGANGMVGEAEVGEMSQDRNGNGTSDTQEAEKD
ncbi:hypothetical protein FRB94_010216 [Tulasnella sp. JGI-2019a]|nr:hypothetical protein FRB93_005326 [Tulasnella sp. JGI-2019a]KAG8993980.1 hypothetical protein FRB94_010216 [Tulasnella sp. JGI-2019a]KAG9029389.1 hypothetical protein FRB95_005344 [Tulasnella sp. JGI-2019a]